jgi:raffinose/stachyose/melibiose transport system permease protein
VIKAVRNKKTKIILLFILPALAVYICMVILPIFMSVFYSTQEWDGIGKAEFTGIQNYIDLAADSTGNFHKAVGNSILLAVASVFIQLPIAFIIARVLAGGVKGEGFFRSVYFIPVIISTVVIGQMWRKIYNPQFGLLNNILENMGLDSLKQEWLGNTETALSAVFIPLLWQYIGYHMLLFYAAIKSVPVDILDAAKIDGVGFWKETLYIIIPMVSYVIEICVILAIIGSLKTFDLIYILTNGGPLHSTEVPSTMMFNSIFHRMSYGYGSAMAVFIVIECLIITIIMKKIFRKSIYTA